MKDKIKSLIDLSQIEPEALKQIYDVASLDIVKKLAIMPDVHTGYDLCIGGVALVEDHISPSFVGYDIGCGMCFVNTGVKKEEIFRSRKEREKIAQQIYKAIPVGNNIRKKPLDYKPFKSASGDKNLTKKVNDKLYHSLGTLGSGNHFIEIGENLEGYVCITIHSGSRNIGHSIASYYMKKGRFLPLKSDIGQAYIQDMNFALEYALENRLTMMKEILKILGFTEKEAKKIIKKTLINENHNHAVITEEGVLHRKGATPADEGQLGIIPANMRDGVYVTVGLGNKEFLSSASHGAGRVLSRRKAKELIDLEEFKKVMDSADIVAKVSPSTLDEAPFAYKDINQVIEAQRGVVVEIIDQVKPVINIKG
ncbi:MAG TPA: RtcB family protein [Persephonella sp.]|uniref:3'-phosphate/5'-hydroxy nucleic acid ligase n=1 Tax=Persephonella marina (strain DSM 14350 / EX-H1) TaxID=123214 RepID=C0QPN7_PERMH|nr:MULTISPECIES: RtcB family protein [Persephonella]ACO03910.1 gp160 [Persephonella marina EX-H1]HCB69752.1 RtcB family protein [Persephonella sp.]